MTKSKRFIPAVSAAIAALIALAVLICVQPAASAESGKTASQITAEMGAGWNLGNSLDATGGWGLSSETSWGNPKTTKAMIDAVKAQGFNTVRVPVSWGNHTSGDNFTIDSAWMARVKEVVDYCIDNDMYVILNIHHDTSTSYYYPDEAHKTQSVKFVTSIWSQVAKEFKDYDQHLIFETLNEPRLVGTNDEWWFPVNSPNSNVTAAIKVINELNQAAVDTIRSAGGNNADRCIMIPGYGASIDGCTTPQFTLPTDSAADRLIVSVHAYTPYNFALNASGTSTFSDDLKSEVDYLFNTLKTKYINKGIPVVIGETSASNKNNAAERIKWADYYFKKAADAGIPCVLWDNNVYSGSGNLGEQHGHLNRKTLEWFDKEFVDTMVKKYGVTVTPTKPSNITGFALGGRAADALRLNWNKNTSADGYIIEKYDGSKWVNIAKITNNATTTYRVTGLAAGTAYKFRMRAYKTDGSTALYSGYTSTLAARTNPSKVTGLTLGGRAADALRLNWNKNASADGYIIEMYNGSKWVRVTKITNNATTTYRVTGLKAGTAYKFRVKSYKMSGKTALYSGYTATLAARTNPSKVTGAKIGGTASTALRLNWTKNTSSDGYIIEIYKGGKWVRAAKITNNATTTYRISGLAKNTNYPLRIKAYKMSGKTALYSGYTAVAGKTTA